MSKVFINWKWRWGEVSWPRDWEKPLYVSKHYGPIEVRRIQADRWEEGENGET